VIALRDAVGELTEGDGDTSMTNGSSGGPLRANATRLKENIVAYADLEKQEHAVL
jgi:hypothetical protein